MTSMRMNMLFALITLGLLLMNSRKLEGRWSLNRTNVLLILWFLHGTLSAIFVYPDLASNWPLYEKLAKVLVFVLIMPLIVYGRLRIHGFVIALRQMIWAQSRYSMPGIAVTSRSNSLVSVSTE